MTDSTLKHGVQRGFDGPCSDAAAFETSPAPRAESRRWKRMLRRVQAAARSLVASAWPAAAERAAAPVLCDRLEPRVLLSAAHDLIGLTAMRNDPLFYDIDGSGVSVVVIDTGVDIHHPLIAPNYIAGVDIVHGGDVPTPLDEHGTHVAGIVGATDPEIGVAPDVNLIAIQAFENVPGLGVVSSAEYVESALQWVLEHQEEYNIVAVNMSLGSGYFTSIEEAAGDPAIDEVETLEEMGVAVVSAAGNDYTLLGADFGGIFQPIAYPNASAPAIYSTFSVGAVWQGDAGEVDWGGVFDHTTAADRITAFSQRPPLTEGTAIFAPGAFIHSTIPGGGFADFPGTSMASPMVAGSVALLQEVALKFGGRLLSTDELQEIVLTTAEAVFDGDDEDNLIVVDLDGDGVIEAGEQIDFTHTLQAYPRLNVYNAAREIVRRFSEIGTPAEGDLNGTIAGAIPGPTLRGRTVSSVAGEIGFDAAIDIGRTDVDMFRFEVTVGGVATFTTTEDPDNPGSMDTVLRLFNATGSELAFNDDGPSMGGFSQLTTALTPGVYYLGVSGFNNSTYDANVPDSGSGGTTGNYRVHFDLDTPDPDGTLVGASHVSLSDNQATFEGELGFDADSPVDVADVDLYRFTAAEDGTLLIDIDGFTSTLLAVFDAEGRFLAYNDDGLSTDVLGNPTEFSDGWFYNYDSPDFDFDTFPTGVDGNSFLRLSVTAGETYYIGVSAEGNSGYDPRTVSGRSDSFDQGLYTLDLTFHNLDLDGSIDTSVDLLDLPVGPVAGTIGQDAGQFVGGRDVDMYHFRPDSDGTLEIQVDSHGEASIADKVNATLFLFDADGNFLAANDNVNGADPLLRYVVEEGVDYYAAVVGFGNFSFDPTTLGSGSQGDTGDYMLSAQLTETIVPQDFIGGDNPEIVLDFALGEFLGSDRGLFRGAADVDIFKFVATESGTVDVRTSRPDAFGADTFLRVFDADGNELASNDNASLGDPASRVVFDVDAGETYYFGVSGAGPDAADYDPLTGEGAGDGSSGAYAIKVTTYVEEAETRPIVTVLATTPDTGEGSAQPGIFTISRAGDLSVDLVVHFHLSGSAEEGSDFLAVPTSVTIPAGQASATIEINAIDDAQGEPEEFVNLTMAQSDQYHLGSPNSAFVRIADDDGRALFVDALHPVVYTDSLGQLVTVAMKGPGHATLRFDTLDLEADPAAITLDDTTRVSSLLIATAGPETTTVGEIITHGELYYLWAPEVDVTGNILVQRADGTGTAHLIYINSITDHSIILGSGSPLFPSASSIVIGSFVEDAGIHSGVGLMHVQVRGGDWITTGDQGPTGIVAPWIGAAAFAGDFDGIVTLSGQNAPRNMAIGAMSVGGSFDGVLDVDGGHLGRLVFGQAGPGATLRAPDSDAGVIAIRGDADLAAKLHRLGNLGISGHAILDLTAESANSIVVLGDLVDSTLSLAGVASGLTAPVLRGLSVGGRFLDSRLETTGDVLAIAAGSLEGSEIYIGVSDDRKNDLDGLPTVSPDPFGSAASLGRLVLRPAAGPSMVDSVIAAARIFDLSLEEVAIDNDGTDFGIVADYLGRLRGRSGGSAFQLVGIDTADQVDTAPHWLSDAQDFKLRIV